MASEFFHRISAVTALVLPVLIASGTGFPAIAQQNQGITPEASAAIAGTPRPSPQNGIAMYGTPMLQEGDSLPYARPDAPKGGEIRINAQEGFDSLNPWILAGRAPEGIAPFVFQTLMIRSIDEPFSLYGLLASGVETDEARSYAEFTLRPEARFSDGTPVTVEDVLWSFETLGNQGHPRYTDAWAKIAKAEITAPDKIRFTFKEPSRELVLLLGLRPVLKKAQYEGKDFSASTMDIPIGSGPYTVEEAIPNRKVVYRRNPDFWGKDLPILQGLYNFDKITHAYYSDQNIAFEAFKAGDLDTWREGNAARWNTGYTFPAVQDGRILRTEIPHQRPSGMQGLVFNTRLPVFQDWRVREALTSVYNFEFISKTINSDAEPRIQSYFDNSTLKAGEGPAEGPVAALLEPFKDTLIEGTLEGYTLPQGDGSAQNRKNTRSAMRLLNAAGWSADDAGVLRNEAGDPFTFEIVLQQGDTEIAPAVDIFVESLKRLGIVPQVTVIDAAQYRERTNRFEFGMAWIRRALSLSPGNEQYLYWGASGIDTPGSRNWMGMNSPAAEAMIATMLEARETEEFTYAVRALDRILTAGRYVIPSWYAQSSRLAYKAELHFPQDVPLYGDWPGFQPDVWWYEAAH
jgi:peptide/nickel transport system substrate-binding protein